MPGRGIPGLVSIKDSTLNPNSMDSEALKLKTVFTPVTQKFQAIVDNSQVNPRCAQGACQQSGSYQTAIMNNPKVVPHCIASTSCPVSERVTSLFTPKIEQGIIEAQAQLIKNLWPLPTKEAWHEAPQFCNLYTTIKSKNLPNFLGAQVTIQSGLKLDAWESALVNFHDREICSYLRYG